MCYYCVDTGHCDKEKECISESNCLDFDPHGRINIDDEDDEDDEDNENVSMQEEYDNWGKKLVEEKEKQLSNNEENMQIQCKISCQIDISIEEMLDCIKIGEIVSFINDFNDDFNHIEIIFKRIQNSDVQIFANDILLFNLSNKVADYISKYYILFLEFH